MSGTVRVGNCMADTNKVNDVLGRFRGWARPWEYIHTSSVQQGLRSAKIHLISVV